MRWLQGGPLLVAASGLFGLMAVLVRASAESLPLGETLMLRFAIATAGAIVAARMLPSHTGDHRGLLVLRGVLGGIAVVLYYYSLFHLPAATAALLNTSSPLFSIAFARIFLGEEPPPGLWLGVGIAGVGTAVVVAGSAGDGAAGTAGGIVAGVLSAVFSGGAIPTVRAARRYYNAGVVFLAFSICGLVVSFPVAWHETWCGGRGLALCLAAALAALGAQLLFTQALGEVEIWLASALGQLTPVLAWVLGLTLLHEHLSPLALGGAVLTLVGVAYASSRETGARGASPMPP